MKHTTNFSYQLPERKDPLSPKPLNENFTAIDDEFGWYKKGLQLRKGGGEQGSYAQVSTTTLSSVAEGSVIQLVEKGALVDFIVAKHSYEPDLNTGKTLVVRAAPVLGDVSHNLLRDDEIGSRQQLYLNVVGTSVAAAAGGVFRYQEAYAQGYPAGDGTYDVSYRTRVSESSTPVTGLSPTELGFSSNVGQDGTLLPTAEALKNALLASLDDGERCWLRGGKYIDTYAVDGTTGDRIYREGRYYLQKSNGALSLAMGGPAVYPAEAIPARFLPAFILPSDLEYTVYTDGQTYYDEQSYADESVMLFPYRSDTPVGLVGNARIEFGSYVGTGAHYDYSTSTPDAGTKITFAHTPKLVCIVCDVAANGAAYSTCAWFPWGAARVEGADSTSQISASLVYDGNMVELRANSAGEQANYSGHTYHYFALY